MTRSLCSLSLVSILFVAPAVMAQAPVAAPAANGHVPDHRTITVTGTATVPFYADAARIQFRLRSSEATLDEARQANRKAVKLADEKLSALKIKDMKIAFAPLSTSQLTTRAARSPFRGGGGGGFPGGGQPAVPDMRTSNQCTQIVTLVVRETDLEKMAEAIGKIEKTLIDAGLVTGTADFDEDGMPIRSGLSISLFRRDDAEFREQALTKAVQNGLQKAKALARGANVQIKETVSIIENDVGASGGTTRAVRSATSATSIPGELEVTVRVTIKCAY